MLDKMENDANQYFTDLHRAQNLELDVARKNVKN